MTPVVDIAGSVDGSVDEQDTFNNAYPTKEIYFTECSGTQGSDWWSDIKVCPSSYSECHSLNFSRHLQWYMDNLYVSIIHPFTSIYIA